MLRCVLIYRAFAAKNFTFRFLSSALALCLLIGSLKAPFHHLHQSASFFLLFISVTGCSLAHFTSLPYLILYLKVRFLARFSVVMQIWLLVLVFSIFSICQILENTKTKVIKWAYVKDEVNKARFSVKPVFECYRLWKGLFKMTRLSYISLRIWPH